MRAALYARFSTEKQSESSIDDQFRVCERLAARHGFEIVGRYSDAALSGGTTQRPGYQSLLTAARSRDFDIIVAEDTSRLWRMLAEQAPRLAELLDLDIHVVTHDLDTRQDSADILGAINGAMAQQYRKEISRRTRRGLEGLARNKKPTGGRAYGYVADSDGERQIQSEHAAIVREIFEYFAGGYSPRWIADELNRRKVPAPGAAWNRKSRRADGIWLSSAIAGDPRKGVGILNNELYRGQIIWNRMRWTRSAADSSKRKPVMNPQNEWIVHTDEALRIVNDELWARAKARQSETHAKSANIRAAMHAAARTGRGPKFLLSGLLKCGECGANFVMGDKSNYVCASRMNGGSHACSNKLRVARKLAESKLLSGIKAEMLQPEYLDAFKREMRAILAAQSKDSTQDRAKRAERLGSLGREIENMVSAISAGLLSPTLKSKLEAAENERAQLLNTRQEVTVAKVAEMLPRMADTYQELLKNLENVPMREVARVRADLKRMLGDVRLVPSDGHLVAEVSLETGRLTEQMLGRQINVVAGARFETYICPRTVRIALK